MGGGRGGIAPVAYRRRDAGAAQRAAMMLAQELTRMEKVQGDGLQERGNPPEASCCTSSPSSSSSAAPDTPISPVTLPEAGSPRLKRKANAAFGPAIQNGRAKQLTPDALQNLHRDASLTLDYFTQVITKSTARQGDGKVKVKSLTEATEQEDHGSASSLDGGTGNTPDQKLSAYIRKCQIAGNVALLDELHNIDLNRRLETEHAKRRQQVHRGIVSRSAQYTELRSLAAALVVSIWQAALKSPSMAGHKRTQEAAFRPFAAGVYISTRRGVNVNTHNGTKVLIPMCPLLAEALPAVRAEHEKNMNPHKGVKCMQQVLKSVPRSKAAEFFADAIRAAHALQVRAHDIMAGAGDGGSEDEERLVEL